MCAPCSSPRRPFSAPIRRHDTRPNSDSGIRLDSRGIFAAFVGSRGIWMQFRLAPECACFADLEQKSLLVLSVGFGTIAYPALLSQATQNQKAPCGDSSTLSVFGQVDGVGLSSQFTRSRPEKQVGTRGRQVAPPPRPGFRPRILLRLSQRWESGELPRWISVRVTARERSGARRIYVICSYSGQNIRLPPAFARPPCGRRSPTRSHR